MKKNLKKLVVISSMLLVSLICTHQLQNKKTNIYQANSFTFSPLTTLSSSKISGEITQDTLFTKGNYTITDDLVIPENVTVVIEQGTNITFKINKVIKIDGTFILNGTEEEQIQINYIFTSTGDIKTFVDISATGNMQAKFLTIKNTQDDHNYKNVTVINNSGTLSLNDNQRNI